MSARLALVLVVAVSAPVWADPIDAEPTGSSTFELAKNAAFAPTIARADTQGNGIAFSALNYNRATRATTLDLSGDVKLYDALHLVLRVDNLADHGRPGIGASYQFLSEARHGVASTAYLVYKTEGFTEVEGEIEGLVAFAKTLGPVRGVVNVAYGQDADAKERDGELAAYLFTPVGDRVLVGATGRYRDALGSGGDKGVLRDAFAGLTGTVVVGPIGVTAMAGLAGVKTVGMTSMATGPSVTLAVGTGF
jgi:hypothetical protein